jgi:hypothetical protein
MICFFLFEADLYPSSFSTRSKTFETIAALKRALEDAGIEFIDPNGGGPGVRLKTNPGSG